MMSNQCAYRLERVTHTYAGQQVLNIHQLEIYQGEILALVGPSGAGKSTLLRLLNLLESPKTGTIEVFGQRFQQHDQVPLHVRRQITTVFQRPVLLSGTVWENVAYGLRLRGQANSRQTALQALEQIGLSHLAAKPARTLSGGEMQRVALARAMVIAPRVLLLDEPTANLDPHNVQLIEQITQRLHQQHQTTMVLVTHNIFQARRLAQRIALLLHGQIIEISATQQFFDQPTDSRTSAFVRGEMIY